jgi:phage head maturation protease
MLTRTAPKIGKLEIRETVGVDKADKPRTIRYVASDETVDRYGDVIRAEGWDLSNYEGNNVLLWGHDHKLPAIGTTKAWVEGTRLMADATFWPEGVSEFADQLWRMAEHGGLKAVSVGFMPTKMPNEIKDPETNEWTGGFEFIAQDLLELSVVSVPANPAALALARSVALSEQTIRRLFTTDPSALAQAALEHRRRSIQLVRLRV